MTTVTYLRGVGEQLVSANIPLNWIPRLCMSSPIARPASCCRRNLPYPDGLRHAQVGEGVDDGGSNVGFVHLSLETPGEQAVLQLLEPVHHVLGNAAPVVAAIVPPAVESLGSNFLNDGVASMVASPRDRAVAWRNGSTRVPLGNRRMAAVAVVGAIGRDLGDLAFDLVEHAGQDFAVARGGGGHFNADDVLGGFVDCQMDLASGAALAHPVLTHFPFAFAEDLQASRIDHHVCRPLTRPARYLQGLCRFVWKRRRWRGIEGTTMSRADEVRAKPNP